jgi:hypothetical protein
MLKKGLSILLVVAVGLFAVTGVVTAQGGEPPAKAASRTYRTPDQAYQGGQEARQGNGLGNALSPIEATAQATGLTEAEVIAALQSDKSYTEIAAEAGVTLNAYAPL